MSIRPEGWGKAEKPADWGQQPNDHGTKAPQSWKKEQPIVSPQAEAKSEKPPEAPALEKATVHLPQTVPEQLRKNRSTENDPLQSKPLQKKASARVSEAKLPKKRKPRVAVICIISAFALIGAGVACILAFQHFNGREDSGMTMQSPPSATSSAAPEKPSSEPSVQPTSPSTAPTMQPTTQSTETPSVSTEPTKKESKPLEQNGYMICPICTFVHAVEEACPACTAHDNGVYDPKVEWNCPNCGGGQDIGGAEPWVYCGFCGDYVVGVEGPYYHCERCKRKDLTPHDLVKGSWLCTSCATSCAMCGAHLTGQEENTIGVCNSCWETGPSHCTKCGKTYLETYINRYFMCEECTEKYWEYGRCGICNAILSTYPEQELGYCYNCQETFCCQGCGKIRADVYEGYCTDCTSNAIICSVCGSDETYRGEYVTLEDGTILCYSCWDSQYGEEPNVWCPSCGYGFFTTGVGIEGFICPECGHNWLP